MAIMLGYTQERSFRKEVFFRNVELGKRFHDIAHETQLVAVETKYGRVGRDALEQLAKDTVALDQGWEVRWEMRDLSLVHRDVLAKMHELAREYPDQFQFREVPTQEAERAMEIGREIALEVEQGKTREAAERDAAEREKAKRHERAVEHEIQQFRIGLDRMPTLEARGQLLNTLEGGAMLRPDMETTRLALTQLQAEHQSMREQAQERALLEYRRQEPTPEQVRPERGKEREPPTPEKHPPLEFDSAERRTALAMHLAEIGVEPDLIEVRMLCELAQAQPPVEAARIPIDGLARMRPHRELDERGRERQRGQGRTR